MTLIFIAVFNLIITEFVLNFVPRETRSKHFFYKLFSYAYFNAFMRPVLFVLIIRSVK